MISVNRVVSLGRICLLAGTLGAALGCSDDDPQGGSGGSGGTGGGSAGAGGQGGGSCGSADTTGCTQVVSPDGDATEALQSALIEVKSGGTVCLCPGSYSLTKEVSLNVPNVTVKGLGATMEDTILDFKKQTQGDDGFTVTSDGFTVENLWLKNSPGNGIVVTGAEGVTFRKLKVSWDAGSVTANGAYAVYPVKSKKVLIEDTEVVGASDAGIYVGQCEQAIVRRNKVYGNVAGIEIENSNDAEVHDNEAYDNTAGILVFVLPNLEKKDGKRSLVHHNKITANNRANFAEDKTVVSYVPAGTGVLILGADQTEIRDNDIKDNQSVSVLTVSLQTFNILLGGTPDPLTDPDPEEVFIHDNTLTNNGTDPQGILGTFKLKPLEDILWDGYEKPNLTGNNFCLGPPPHPSFRNFQAASGGLADNAVHTTDSTPHACGHTPLPSVTF
ncbi:MAG: parallel beta-helix domain-containing protein [Polyangiaceae bacterium]